MRYMFLVYDDEKNPEQGSPAIMAEYGAFGQMATEKGVIRDGNRLHNSDAATTVRVRNGATQTTDGPFAETKEQLGGYFIFDCKDLNEALAYAAKVPSAKFGSVEVRPILRCSCAFAQGEFADGQLRSVTCPRRQSREQGRTTP